MCFARLHVHTENKLVAMAVTIMFGLAFGTVLTMILLPVLYATSFRLQSPD